ncbi:major facilitator superfamily domain-containing protein 1 [Episyrphus balteatus]|uniref:major facilitator superfamily domain-containing protein 1 n=1 Tax=Episyrphus balteatus TaxID=286459 RepID=UPI0024862CDD|nr:major facilitator superfamily domain-containing protein 1 [Episyrphus balteatus]
MPRSSDRVPIVENDELSQEALAVSPATAVPQRDNELDPAPTGCGASMCCNPSSGLHRFIALIFMCLLGFGSYFCYDSPGALQDVFKKELNLTSTEFNFLYSIYSWPNVVLCFIGGFLIDRVFGIRMGTIIYLFILVIGQLVFSFGGLLDTYWLMVLGRFVFGIGAESLAVAQNNYAVLWFKGKELNMVFGLQLSFARIGSAVNFLVMEPLYKHVTEFYHGSTAVGVVLLLAGVTCVISFFCALILGCMDKRAERILGRNNNPSGEVVKLSDVFTFKTSFWLVSIICVAYYVAIFPFIAMGKVFFKEKYGFTPEQANTVNSMVYLVAAVASPIFGFVIDLTGRNVSWVFLSTVFAIFSHSLMAFTNISPYYCMLMLGFSYSMLAASLWPLIALIIPEYQLGTAYGFCQSVQNLGLAVVLIVSGIIVDMSGGKFIWVQLFFIGWLTISLIATCAIWGYDRKIKGNLNMTPQERITYNSKIGHEGNRARHADDIYSSDQEPLLDN